MTGARFYGIYEQNYRAPVNGGKSEQKHAIDLARRWIYFIFVRRIRKSLHTLALACAKLFLAAGGGLVRRQSSADLSVVARRTLGYKFPALSSEDFTNKGFLRKKK